MPLILLMVGFCSCDNAYLFILINGGLLLLFTKKYYNIYIRKIQEKKAHKLNT